MFLSNRLGSFLRSLILRKVKKSNPMKYKKRKFHENTLDKLLKVLHPASKEMGDKVSIIGIGQVGMACAISILARNVAHHICLFDKDEDRMKGEMLDLQHGSIFFQDAKIESATGNKYTGLSFESDHTRLITIQLAAMNALNFKQQTNLIELKGTEGSKLCIVCAGVRRKHGESVLNLLQRNAEIFKHLIPGLVKYSPNTLLMILTNPVDILSYVAWKLSGLPVYKVFGTGTNLDTARFRVLLGQKLGISPTNVHGYIIGEHGDNSVAAWSGVSVAGTLLANVNKKLGHTDDPERWGNLHNTVVRSPNQVIKLKGYTNWAIGLSVSDLTWACLGNTLRIHPISTLVKGIHGIEEEVYLSLPCVMSSNGISKVVVQNLTPNERDKLANCAKLMKVIQGKLKL